MHDVRLNDVLLAAAYLTSIEGYVKAEFGNDSTSFKTKELLSRGDVENLDLVTSYQDRVDAAIAWIRVQDSSEYINKILGLLSCTVTGDKNISILSSLFAGYDRNLYYKKEHQGDLQCTHMGKEGDTVVFTLDHWKFVTECTSSYGASYLYKLYDDENHLYIWFTKKRIDDELQDLRNIRATIKKHTARDNVKQNQISNVSVT